MLFILFLYSKMPFLMMFLMLFILLFSLSVVFSKNPVRSVFSLIGVFFFSFLLLLAINLDFFALLYLIIYIGAIAVLFLFIVMMLNLNIIESLDKPTLFPFLIILLSINFLIASIFLIGSDLDEFVFLFNSKFVHDFYAYLVNFYLIFETNFVASLESSLLITQDSNKFYYNQLYNIEKQIINNFYYLLFVGLLLTFALVGVIDLVTRKRFLKTSNIKNQNVFEQINRTINQSIILLKNGVSI